MNDNNIMFFLIVLAVLVSLISIWVDGLEKKIEVLESRIEGLVEELKELSLEVVALKIQAEEIPEVRLPDRYYPEPVKETSKMEVGIDE